MAQAATPTITPSQSLITSPPIPVIGMTSHTDVPTQLRVHQLTNQTDRPSVSGTCQWDERTLIGVGSSDPLRPATPNLQDKPFLVGIVHPLLGPSTPSSSPTKPSQVRPPLASPRSPRRQTRIPSTGSRTLVMDVAQALQEAQEATTEAEVTAQSPISHPAPGQVKPELPALPIEKRKSGFDMYSDHVMPSLAEEGLSTDRAYSPNLICRKSRSTRT